MNAKWVKVESGIFSACRFMSVKSIGMGFKAASEYSSSGVLPEGLDEAAQVVFEMLRSGIDASEAEYAQICARNRERACKRWGSTMTDASGIPTAYQPHTSGIPTACSTAYSTACRIDNIREDNNRLDNNIKSARARTRTRKAENPALNYDQRPADQLAAEYERCFVDLSRPPEEE